MVLSPTNFVMRRRASPLVPQSLWVVQIELSNAGGSVTTLRHVSVRVYKNHWQRWLCRKPMTELRVETPMTALLPRRLAPSDPWQCAVRELDLRPHRGRAFYFCAKHTMSKRPVLTRLHWR